MSKGDSLPVVRPEDVVIPDDPRLRSALLNKRYLAGVYTLQAAIGRDLPPYEIKDLTTHHFCAGMYCRQFDLPAGGVAVGKMHAEESFFLLVKGQASFTTETGTVTVDAPYLCVTVPGSKRAVFAHTDCTWLTFHPNPENSTEVPVLESRIIVPDPQPALTRATPAAELEST